MADFVTKQVRRDKARLVLLSRSRPTRTHRRGPVPLGVACDRPARDASPTRSSPASPGIATRSWWPATWRTSRSRGSASSATS